MRSIGSICRIGVFYDGSFFAYAQRYLYHERQLGWLSFQPLHTFFEQFLAQKNVPFYPLTSHVYGGIVCTFSSLSVKLIISLLLINSTCIKRE